MIDKPELPICASIIELYLYINLTIIIIY